MAVEEAMVLSGDQRRELARVAAAPKPAPNTNHLAFRFRRVQKDPPFAAVRAAFRSLMRAADLICSSARSARAEVSCA